MNQETLKNIFVNPNLTRELKGNHCFVLATPRLDLNNPFVNKVYDFDKQFYQGQFEFKDPVTGSLENGTPEEYGRRRMVANLERLGLKDAKILDLGAGTLNIFRQLSEEFRKSTSLFVNCDISGPWIGKNGSSMELGVKRLKTGLFSSRMVNVQYDLNSIDWPFQPNIFDCVVSCMAIHHVRYKNKAKIIESIFRSLKAGGKFMIMDFFLKQEGGAKVTDAGQKGPEECGGYGQKFSNFLGLCQKTGFILDEFSQHFAINQSLLTPIELKLAIDDISKTIQVNKATWFTILSKKE